MMALYLGTQQNDNKTTNFIEHPIASSYNQLGCMSVDLRSNAIEIATNWPCWHGGLYDYLYNKPCVCNETLHEKLEIDMMELRVSTMFEF